MEIYKIDQKGTEELRRSLRKDGSGVEEIINNVPLPECPMCREKGFEDTTLQIIGKNAVMCIFCQIEYPMPPKK